MRRVMNAAKRKKVVADVVVSYVVSKVVVESVTAVCPSFGHVWNDAASNALPELRTRERNIKISQQLQNK